MLAAPSIPLSRLIPMPGSAAALLLLQSSSRPLGMPPLGVPKPALGSPQRREQSRESFSLAHTSLLLLRKPLPRIFAWNMSVCLGGAAHPSLPKCPESRSRHRQRRGWRRRLLRDHRCGFEPRDAPHGKVVRDEKDKKKKKKIQMEFAPVGSGVAVVLKRLAQLQDE